jgi:hypothetical protein
LATGLYWGEFSPDGKRLLTVSHGTQATQPRIVTWDIETRQPLVVYRIDARAAWFTGDALAALGRTGSGVFRRRSPSGFPYG